MKEQLVSAESKQRTAVLLSDLWSRNRPVVEARLDLLERASTGTLAEEQRIEAASVAHKLAGSLGMFGFPQGTEIARELEHLLERSTPSGDDVARLVQQLRSVLFPGT